MLLKVLEERHGEEPFLPEPADVVGADVMQLLDLDAGEAVKVGQRAIGVDVGAVWVWYLEVDLVVDL